MVRLLALTVIALICGYAATQTAESVCDNPTIAAACEDELGDACGVFTAATPPTVDDKCNNATFSDLAKKCMKTCLMCCKDPAYDCEDNPKTSMNCTVIQMQGLCTDPGFLDVLTIECPQSCGLCASGSCVNKDPDMCATIPPVYCKHEDYKEIMEQNCARMCDMCDATAGTGGTTGTGTSDATTAAVTTEGVTTAAVTTSGEVLCLDIATNCGENQAICTDPRYVDLMKQKCAATCNYCTGGTTGGTGTCVDSNTNCATWATQGFCSSTYYTAAQKAQYCKRTCSLC